MKTEFLYLFFVRRILEKLGLASVEALCLLMNVRSECHIPNTSELTNSIFTGVVTNICNTCVYPTLLEVHTTSPHSIF